MTSRTNRRWVMAKRPVGEPTEECFELQERPVPALASGEVLSPAEWTTTWYSSKLSGRARASLSLLAKGSVHSYQDER